MTGKDVITFWEDECGTTAIEYAMIAALVSIVLVTAAGEIGSSLSGTFSSIGNVLEGEIPSSPPQGLQQ